MTGLLKVPDSQEKLYLMDPLKRTGQPFGGLLNDVRRRLPQYWSDIRDGLNFHCLATFFFVFLACVAPAITFGGILGETQSLLLYAHSVHVPLSYLCCFILFLAESKRNHCSHDGTRVCMCPFGLLTR